MEFVGYALVAMANVVLADSGITVATWQWWAINLCFIIGEFIICNSNSKE